MPYKVLGLKSRRVREIPYGFVGPIEKNVSPLHNIAEILLKVALKHYKPKPYISWKLLIFSEQQ
jgi:hypothetical protein